MDVLLLDGPWDGRVVKIADGQNIIWVPVPDLRTMTASYIYYHIQSLHCRGEVSWVATTVKDANPFQLLIDGYRK